jgi:hypothetical protein
MPNGQPAQLANLQRFQPGHKAPRYSAAVVKAITECRKVSLEMVGIVLDVARDPETPVAVRLKAAELILERALPKRENSLAAQFALGEGASVIRIEIVDPLNAPNDNQAVDISFNRLD